MRREAGVWWGSSRGPAEGAGAYKKACEAAGLSSCRPWPVQASRARTPRLAWGARVSTCHLTRRSRIRGGTPVRAGQVMYVDSISTEGVTSSPSPERPCAALAAAAGVLDVLGLDTCLRMQRPRLVCPRLDWHGANADHNPTRDSPPVRPVTSSGPLPCGCAGSRSPPPALPPSHKPTTC